MKLAVRNNHPRTRVALVLALSLAAALGPVWLAPAVAAGPVVSSAMIPLSGQVGGVSLTGVLHVVTQVLIPSDPCIPPDPCKPATLTVHANLPAGDVTAVGAPSIDYLAHGAGTASENFDVSVPPDPITPPDPIVPGFVLMTVGKNHTPPDPIAPVPFALQLHLSFTSDGVLQPDASSATTSCSVDFGCGP